MIGEKEPHASEIGDAESAGIVVAIPCKKGVVGYMDVLGLEQKELGGFANSDMSPHLFAPGVKAPTLVVQVRDDLWTTPEDGQKAFDLWGGNEKELFWIQGTARRFDGYNCSGQNPKRIIDWFRNYMH